ncbi:MAG: Endonuclease III [candidate division BRC1 bacterium ADurb.BinA364]|nr:MAG: Endonuclease III [candidate division BRC1 bacterium ADurb.BinA364]
MQAKGQAPGSDFPIEKALRAVAREAAKWKTPIVTRMAENKRSPFEILVSTVLSLRTKDETTAAASERLFARARSPQALLDLEEGEIARLIYPVGFYNVKARQLREIARLVIERHGGRIPREMDELLALPGVGRKTANLTRTLGHRLPGICVDTHVHRITNRWGYVKTKTPEETEFALREKLPQRYWIPINDWLVTYGQNVCAPVSPKCSQCPLEPICPKIGVGRSR